MLQYQSENFGKSFDYRHRYHDRFVIPAHIHEYSELLYVLSGEMTMYIRGERHLVPAGHVAFVLPNEIHAYTDETPCRCMCAVFSNDFIPLFLQQVGEGMLAMPVADMRHCTSLLASLEQTAFTDSMRLVGLLNLLYDAFLKQTKIVARPQEGVHLYQSAIAYIAKHFTEDITLSDVAAQLGYHEKYLSSALHSLTGMHFCMFLASYRVDLAKRILLSDAGQGKSISQVAMEVGFSSINTFNRSFKRLTGVTPVEYRKSRRGA
ncbi:MAG: AraC family transcriptional regulator [Clostridia bacterium]|nr:AraC family transcriptional regulator [Clostridia bacterium]